MRQFFDWLALLACATWLAACGGGGGNPGTITNSTAVPAVATSSVASVVLIPGAGSILASGADGTEVTLTAVVKDASNNVLVGETVDFSASSGAITRTVRLTDSSGQVVEKLSVKGDSTLRDIVITASVGSGSAKVASSPVTVKVVAATSSQYSMLMTSSSSTLPSAGTSEVSLFALIKDGNNAVVPLKEVTFSADSGALSKTVASTDGKGVATVTLSTGADPTLRVINVTASAGGSTATTQISVTGTKLSISASSSINLHASTDMTVKLVDSSNNALVGKAVVFSALNNPVTVKGSGAASPAFTDSNGQVILTYQANSGSSDVVTVKAMGDTVSTGLTINASTFNVNAVDAGNLAQASANINVCQKVAIHKDVAGVPQTGAVSLNTSRGTIYSDAGCGVASGALTFDGSGNAYGYIRATGPGVASLTATAGGTAVQGTVEFVAPLTASATISLQASPAVLGTNTSGGSTEQSALRAVVRDGTAQNNLVKNALVNFSIQTDPSGGYLTSPSVLTTGSDGSATVNFVAGQTSSAVDGVVIQAQIQGVSTSTGSVKLTVAKKSLFISAGSGNNILTPDNSTYRLDYVVFVTDAAGNPVENVIITAAIKPRNYYKGFMTYVVAAATGTGTWTKTTNLACANEDGDGDGLYSAAKDVNGNGRLDPGIPVTVSPSGKTDSGGMATVSLTYARNQANWLDIDLTIRGQVAGTESTYIAYALLPGAATDYNSPSVSPPGQVSPYGQTTLCNIKD